MAITCSITSDKIVGICGCEMCEKHCWRNYGPGFEYCRRGCGDSFTGYDVTLTSTAPSNLSSLTPTTGPSNSDVLGNDEPPSSRPSHIQGFVASLARTRGPRGRSAPNPASRPTRTPQQPRHAAVCEACGKFGHPASRCDMLAMAIFVNRYSRNRDNATALREIEARWVERSKPHLPRDERSPRTILANYCAEMEFSEEQVDYELDWDYLHDPSGAEETFNE